MGLNKSCLFTEILMKKVQFWILRLKGRMYGWEAFAGVALTALNKSHKSEDCLTWLAFLCSQNLKAQAATTATIKNASCTHDQWYNSCSLCSTFTCIFLLLLFNNPVRRALSFPLQMRFKLMTHPYGYATGKKWKAVLKPKSFPFLCAHFTKLAVE